MRATRQTELQESFPSHVVCAWIGNSEKVARKHDPQVTEGHVAKAVQNPVHPAATPGHTGQHDGEAESEIGSDILRDVALCGLGAW
jgi:hypothetical protein